MLNSHVGRWEEGGILPSASETTASYAVFQSMPSVRFLMNASAITTSAFDPPWVYPLLKLILQSGSLPSTIF